MDNESQEMYLRTIYEFEEDGKYARVTDLSTKLKVAPASVTEMVGKLVKKGLVNHKAYGGITLTKKGKKGGERLIRKFRLLGCFLREYLGITNCLHDACRLEHVFSDEAECRLCVLMGHPTRCPNGTVIPKCNSSRPCSECMRIMRRKIRPLKKKK
ncbi:MAG: metal-dependent transcriptional regulator [Candidatus Micrarchaeota archaeon]